MLVSRIGWQLRSQRRFLDRDSPEDCERWKDRSKEERGQRRKRYSEPGQLEQQAKIRWMPYPAEWSSFDDAMVGGDRDVYREKPAKLPDRPAAQG